MKINRILQDKINRLSNDELEELAKSYVGKTAMIINDGYLFTKTIEILEFTPLIYYYPDGLDVGFVQNTKIEDVRVGDKTILFNDKDGMGYQLLELAVVGDTLNVRQSGGSYSNLTIKELDETHILFTDEFGVIPDKLMNFPISRKSMITPMVMQIGWIESHLTKKRYNTPSVQIDYKFELNDLFATKENELFMVFGNQGFEVVLKDTSGEMTMDELSLSKKIDSGEYTYLKDLKVGDVFINNQEGLRIEIVEILEETFVYFDQYDTDDNKLVRRNEGSSQKKLKNDLIVKGYEFVSRIGQSADVPQMDTFVVTTDKTLNMSGDFIGQFINQNADNLLELEKNNKEVFNVVEMTLNFLNSKFSKGDIADKVQDIVQVSQDVVQGDTDLIKLKEIRVLSNEGKVDLKSKTYTTWTDFTNAMKPLYDDTIAGYNKVTFQVTFEDSSSFIDRVDVGKNDYNPLMQNIGEYVERPFAIQDELGDDLDAYQWDDEIGEAFIDNDNGGFSAQDIQEEIDNLEISLMYEEDEDTIQFINDKIEQLKFSLTLI